MGNDETLFDVQTNVLTNADVASKIDFTRLSVNLEEMPDDKEDMGIKLTFHTWDKAVVDGPYSLTYAPPENALSVQKFVLETLGRVDLKEMTEQLVNAASLIDVAYNACDGIDGAFSSMYKVRNEVSDVVADSVKTAFVFQNTSQRALLILFQAYNFICGKNPNPNNAINSFKTCATVSGIMATKATELANKFDKVKESVETQGAEVAKIEETKITEDNDLKQKIQELKSTIDGLNSSKDSLKDQIDEAKKMYEKYDKEANDLQKTADKMELASIICQGVGAVAQGLGNAFATYEESKKPSLDINTKTSQQTKKDDNSKETTQQVPADLEQKNKDLGTVKADIELAEGRVKSNTAKIETLKHELAVVKGTETDDKITKPYREEKTIQDEIDATQKLINGDNTSLTTLNSQKKDYEAWIAARVASSASESVEDATGKISKELDDKSNTAQQAASARQEAADKMLELKFDLQKKQTENLQKLAEYTTQIKSAQINSVDLTIVINSLQIAVTCLSMTTDIMRQTAVFWNNMSTLCSNLASNDIVTNLQSDLELYGPENVGTVYKTDAVFALSMFLLICQWDAVYLICKEYYTSSQVANGILSDSQWRAEMDPKDHWNLAKQLAEQLEEKLNVQIVNSSQKGEAYKNAVDANEKAREEQDKQIQTIITAGST